MMACISRTLMCHDLWDADHCPCVEREPNWAPQPELDASVKRVTSVSLVARGRPCRTAGDAHQATSDSTHWGTVIRSVQLPVLWHHAVAAHHWTGRRWSLPRCTSEAINTSMPINLCRSPAVMFGLVIQWRWTDWTLRPIFCRAPLWPVECWTASRWTGSPDLEWSLTSHSWWSSRETGAHWWSSGHAVGPVLEYLHGSARRQSRCAASHLVVLIELRPGVKAGWTPEMKLPISRVDKWNGRLACWPQNADTFLWPCASGHGETRCECPLDEDLLSFSEPGTAGCSTRGKSRRWPTLRPPSTARRPRPAGGLDGWSWSGSWCNDGWAEVFEGKWCPSRPRQCWWPDRCPADSYTVGQSLPGEPPPGPRQRCEDPWTGPTSQYSAPEAKRQSFWVGSPAVAVESWKQLQILLKLRRPGLLGLWPVMRAVEVMVSTSDGWSNHDTLSVTSFSPRSRRDALVALPDLAGLTLNVPLDDVTAWRNRWYCTAETFLGSLVILLVRDRLVLHFLRWV